MFPAEFPSAPPVVAPFEAVELLRLRQFFYVLILKSLPVFVVVVVVDVEIVVVVEVVEVVNTELLRLLSEGRLLLSDGRLLMDSVEVVCRSGLSPAGRSEGGLMNGRHRRCGP